MRLLFLLFIVALVNGTIVEIKNTTWPAQWQLVAKFCFDKEGGTINIKASDIPPNQQVLLYHDFEQGGFADVALSGHDCSYKMEKATSNRVKADDYDMKDLDNGRSIKVTSKYRPRWWYFVLANCDEAADLPKPYKFHQNVSVGMMKFEFLNTNSSYPQIGKDEEGIYETLIVALVVQLLLLFASGFVFYKQLSDEGQKIHQLTFCSCVVLGFEVVSCIVKIAHYDAFNSDGVGHPSYLDFANLLDIFPDCIMVGLFVLISKGWQISEANFSRLYTNDEGGRRSTLEYLFFYLGCSIALYYWSFQEGKPYEVRFIYQSVPGYMIMGLHFLTMLWFTTNLCATFRHARVLVVKAFYCIFGLFGITYLLLLPVVIIVAEFLYDWNRTRAVVITQLIMNMCVYTFFFFFFGLNAHHLKKDIQEGMAFGGHGGQSSDAFDDGMIDLGGDVGTAEHEEDQPEFDA